MSEKEGFANWIRLRDPKTLKYNLPKFDKRILVRTVDEEVFVMVFRDVPYDNNHSYCYFEISTYSGNFRLGRWPLTAILQWNYLPGFED